MDQNSTLQDTLDAVTDMYSTLGSTVLNLTKSQVEEIMNGGGSLSSEDKGRLDTFMRRRINAGLTAFSWSDMNMDTTSADPNW